MQILASQWVVDSPVGVAAVGKNNSPSEERHVHSVQCGEHQAMAKALAVVLAEFAE